MSLKSTSSWGRQTSIRMLHERVICQQHFHPNGYHAPAHAHVGTEVIYSENGHGSIRISENEYTLMPGSLLIFPARLPHRASVSHNYMRWNLCALPTYFDHDTALNRTVVHEQLSSSAEHNIKNIFQNIASEISAQHDNMDQYIRLLIKQFVLWLGRGRTNSHPLHPKPAPITADSLLPELTNYIETHLQDNLSVESLAKTFNYSRSQIWRIINSATGQSPIEYITDRRLNRACILLRQGNQTMASIAHMAGFKSSAYFSRVFKEKMGITPGEYRAGDTHDTVRAKNHS